MAKKTNKNLNGLLIVAALILFAYGGQQGWFQSIFTTESLNTTIINQLGEPDTTSTSCYLTFDKQTYNVGEDIKLTISDGYNQGCDVYVNPNNLGWIFFDSIITNSNGIATVTGSLDNQGSFLVRAICGTCVTNTKQITVVDTTVPCTDTDGGKDKNVPGHVTTDTSYYDDCAGNWAVIEYFCNGDTLDSEIIGCDPGYICTETRSGDYCMVIDHGYDEGETILTESDEGTMGTGINSIINPIEMSSITEGDCSLGVKIDVWWDYVDEQACTNLQGFEQMAFYFYDSNTGIALDVPRDTPKHFDFCPKYYDGITDWRFEMTKLMSIYTCQIDYDYTVEVYACDCGQ